MQSDLEKLNQWLSSTMEQIDWYTKLYDLVSSQRVSDIQSGREFKRHIAERIMEAVRYAKELEQEIKEHD